ncbi:MAG: hypothetical protein U0531_02410 [Dehalococcoidia bacterium]
MVLGDDGIGDVISLVDRWMLMPAVEQRAEHTGGVAGVFLHAGADDAHLAERRVRDQAGRADVLGHRLDDLHRAAQVHPG